MDFYFIKVRVRSKATAEEMLGYFFGKAGKEPEFDFIVVPARYGNMLNLPLNTGYREFMNSYRALKERVFEEASEAVELTDDFMNYLRLQIQRKGPDLFGAELSAAVKSGNVDLVHYIISELVKDWTPRSDIVVEIKSLSVEELSMENFLSQAEDLGEENLAEILSRPDVKDLPEIFPIIDPIYGKPISRFNIGDPIFFVVLNPGNEENLKKLENAFPNHFKDGVNIKPLAGTLISKEMILGKKGGRYFLIKVDFGKGIIGKGVVLRSLKIMGDMERLEEKLSKFKNDEELFEKVTEVVKNTMKNELPNVSKKKSESVVVTKYHTTSGTDFLIAFLMTILIVGMILIVSYFFF
jgi:hypothetical protein